MKVFSRGLMRRREEGSRRRPREGGRRIATGRGERRKSREGPFEIEELVVKKEVVSASDRIDRLDEGKWGPEGGVVGLNEGGGKREGRRGEREETNRDGRWREEEREEREVLDVERQKLFTQSLYREQIEQKQKAPQSLMVERHQPSQRLQLRRTFHRMRAVLVPSLWLLQLIHLPAGILAWLEETR